MSVCPHTGVTRPECSCSNCLAEQIRQFQPTLLGAGPTGPTSAIRMTRGLGASIENAAGRPAAA